MNSRRLWLLAAALAALTLAAPAAAAPRHYKVLGKARHHLGKPKHKQLIAVRHGHRIHWFSKTHGLPKHKLPPIKLSANVKFAHAGIRAFGPTSAPTVTGTGGCSFGALSLTSPDGMSYVQSYGHLFADVLNCVGNDGGNTESNAFFPSPACVNSGADSVNEAPLEVAKFMDGEWMVLCTVPDDSGTGGSAGERPARALRRLPAGLPLRGRGGNRIVWQFGLHRQDQRLARVLADLQRERSDRHGADDVMHRPAAKR